jgi:hypothetical protein
MNNFFNTHDFIVSKMMLIWLIPVHLIYRPAIALLYLCRLDGGERSYRYTGILVAWNAT